MPDGPPLPTAAPLPREKGRESLRAVAAPDIPIGLVYLISLVLAGCSLLYELLIAQTLTLIAGNMVIWYSLTIGTYLAAMGVGAIVYGRMGDQGHTLARLLKLEIILSAVGAATVLLLYAAHTLHLYFVVKGVIEEVSAAGFYLVCFAVTFGVGILTGIELPLLIRLGNDTAHKDVTNRVLGWDYIGALGGGVIFPLFLVPFIELHTIGFMVAGLNLLVAAFVAMRLPTGQVGWGTKIASTTLLGVGILAGILFAEPIEQFFLKKYYFQFEGQHRGLDFLLDPLDEMPEVKREFSPYQKIDIVHYPVEIDPIVDAYSSKFATHPDIPRNHFLFLNGDNQFTSNFEEFYHEWFAHVPIIAGGKVPKRVLVMGGGDGLLHRELTKYDEVEEIVHVDIDHRLVEMASEEPMLKATNGGAFSDPRNRTIFADAFKFIREYDGEPFDAIYLDFPTIRDYNVSRLYTREFYHFVRVNLADDGFVTLDTPRLWQWTRENAEGKEESYAAGTWEIHSNTMRHAGFKTVIPFFSNLETENPKALEALLKSDKLQRAIAKGNGSMDSDSAQRKWAEDYLGRLWRLRMGFIMLRKDTLQGPFEYVDFGIQMHLLNEQRFGLAFPYLPEPTDEVDLSMVNSILRPKLPKGDMSDIRAAF